MHAMLLDILDGEMDFLRPPRRRIGPSALLGVREDMGLDWGAWKRGGPVLPPRPGTRRFRTPDTDREGTVYDFEAEDDVYHPASPFAGEDLGPDGLPAALDVLVDGYIGRVTGGVTTTRERRAMRVLVLVGHGGYWE